MKKFNDDIVQLQSFQRSVQQMEHLYDIDLLWNQCRQTNDELKEKVEESQRERQQLKEKWIEQQKTYDESIQSLQKKSKVAYCIAGGSLFLTIVQMTLLVLGIL